MVMDALKQLNDAGWSMFSNGNRVSVEVAAAVLGDDDESDSVRLVGPNRRFLSVTNTQDVAACAYFEAGRDERCVADPPLAMMVAALADRGCFVGDGPCEWSGYLALRRGESVSVRIGSYVLAPQVDANGLAQLVQGPAVQALDRAIVHRFELDAAGAMLSATRESWMEYTWPQRMDILVELRRTAGRGWNARTLALGAYDYLRHRCATPEEVSERKQLLLNAMAAGKMNPRTLVRLTSYIENDLSRRCHAEDELQRREAALWRCLGTGLTVPMAIRLVELAGASGESGAFEERIRAFDKLYVGRHGRALMAMQDLERLLVGGSAGLPLSRATELYLEVLKALKSVGQHNLMDAAWDGLIQLKTGGAALEQLVPQYVQAVILTGNAFDALQAISHRAPELSVSNGAVHIGSVAVPIRNDINDGWLMASGSSTRL